MRFCVMLCCRVTIRPFRSQLMNVAQELPLAAPPQSLLVSSVRNNSCRTSVTRIHRKHYARMYPTLLVFPDGSTISIRHKEPRAIITVI